jgi:hypothetical protein
MPRPATTTVNILDKRHREDGGAGLLVQVALRIGDVRWLAVRIAGGAAVGAAGPAVVDTGQVRWLVPSRPSAMAGRTQDRCRGVRARALAAPRMLSGQPWSAQHRLCSHES